MSASTSAVAGQNDGFLGGFRTWTFNDGATVNLRARPNQGYVFSQWGGNASGTSATTTIVMDGNKAATAIFAPAPTPTPTHYSLTISVTLLGGASGSVSPGPGTHSRVAGTSVTITTTAFDSNIRWGGACSHRGARSSCTLTMNGHRSVSVTFSPRIGFQEEEEDAASTTTVTATATATATPPP